MSILNFLKDLVKPIVGLVDSLHVSDEERGVLNNELVKLENTISIKLLDYENKLLESQATIVKAEVQGQSWLQRNWRPITALTMLVLVVGHYLGLLAFPIADEAWMLLNLCLGGYIVGRTVEKTVPNIIEKLKK